MATIKQKKIARLIVENATLDKPLNAKQLLAKGGYGIGMQTQPNRILESEGVKEELDILGFNEDAAKEVVKEIMHNKELDPNARLRATDQVFKVEGSYAPEKTQALNLNINARLDDKDGLEALRKEFEAKLKSNLSST